MHSAARPNPSVKRLPTSLARRQTNANRAPLASRPTRPQAPLVDTESSLFGADSEDFVVLDSAAGQDFEVSDYETLGADEDYETLDDFEVIEDLSGDDAENLVELAPVVASSTVPAPRFRRLPVSRPSSDAPVKAQTSRQDFETRSPVRAAPTRPAPVRPKPSSASESRDTSAPARASTASNAPSTQSKPAAPKAASKAANKTTTKKPAAKTTKKATKAAPKKKKKIYLNKDRDSNDMRIMAVARDLQWATAMHYAYMLGKSHDNVSKRLRDLESAGYLQRDDKHEYPLYGLTEKGAQAAKSSIGALTSASKKRATSTFAHRNKINTLMTFFHLGAAEFERNGIREFQAQVRNLERRNARTVDYNEILAAEQDRIRAIPENQRTIAEQRKLENYGPRSFVEIPEIPAPTIDGSDYTHYPQAVINEERILFDIARFGDPDCAANWAQGMRDLRNTPEWPVREQGDTSQPSPEEIAVMEDSVKLASWPLQHWNTGIEGTKTFERRHRPDGVLLRPHRRMPNGDLKPMNIWLELEENAKTVPYVKQVILQAMDHPLVRGIIYFTNDSDVRRIVSAAMSKVAKELSVGIQRESNMSGRAMSHEQAMELATTQVKKAVRLQEAPLINTGMNQDGFWG